MKNSATTVSRIFASSASLAAAVVLLAGTAASGQCQLLVRESFRPGERPHGNGRLRAAEIHDTLKDYWPQLPDDGTKWMASDTSGTPNWGFAGSSLDPAEVDPLDPYNGTAFGEADSVALLPFHAPVSATGSPVAFTVSADAVMGFGTTSATFLGCTSNPALLSNFQTHGTLWMSLDGSGNWGIYANGSSVIASGQAPIVGAMNSGWLRMEFTYDPATSTVSGRVMDTVIPPTPVTLTRPLAYLGMEASQSWNVLNNLSVFTGASAGITVPAPAPAAPGQTVVLSASTNAVAPAVFMWSRDGVPLQDGAAADGSALSGTDTATLTIMSVTPASAGSYTCEVSNACGRSASNAAVLSIGQSCSPADIAGGGPDGTSPDGIVDGTDFVTFINSFAIGDPAVSAQADIAGGGAAGDLPDGNIDGTDFVAFINAFSQGCP